MYMYTSVNTCTHTSMCPGSLSCVASKNIALATDGFNTVLLKKLATGSPPYLLILININILTS